MESRNRSPRFFHTFGFLRSNTLALDLADDNTVSGVRCVAQARVCLMGKGGRVG